MELIDTHAHIYSPEFSEDIKDILTRAKAQQISKILMPNIDLESYTKMMALNVEYPELCIPMLGVHPCSVELEWESQLNNLFTNFETNKFVGIGEIGLDLYWDKTKFEAQKQALIWQCEFALKHDLPVALHTREATTETIEIIKPFSENGLRGVFHCFGDNLTLANEIISMGFYLGIGGVLTFKKSGLAETLAAVSLDHLVLETDSPYLAPTPYRGKRNEPAYTYEIAKKLAEVKGVSYSEVLSVTSENARKLFKL